jgi:hypothetical protein
VGFGWTSIDRDVVFFFMGSGLRVAVAGWQWGVMEWQWLGGSGGVGLDSSFQAF